MHALLTIPLFACLFVFFIINLLRKKWWLSALALLLVAIVNFYAEIISCGGLFQVNKMHFVFTVMTYNVHNTSKDYKEKQVAIAEEISFLSPDIVFLTEFILKYNRRLDSIMTIENGYIRYYLSGTNSVFYSKHAVDSIAGVYTTEAKRRSSLNNRVHVFLGQDTLTIVGCHLSSSNHHVRRGYQKRKYEADAIYESIKDEKYPVIVMGDLNDISGSYAIERIKEAGLKDAWWEGGCGYGATFHDKWLRLRLDHILYDKDRLNLQYVKVNDSDLSNHNALVAGFTIIKR